MTGTWVLDSQALSLYLLTDRKMTARLAVAREDDIRVVISATKPVRILTSDPDDVEKLLANGVVRSSRGRVAGGSKVMIVPV